jgi:hypothetical protein
MCEAIILPVCAFTAWTGTTLSCTLHNTALFHSYLHSHQSLPYSSAVRYSNVSDVFERAQVQIVAGPPNIQVELFVVFFSPTRGRPAPNPFH